MTLDQSTKVTIGLVITIAGAAASFGVVWQKLNDMDRRLVRIENKIDGNKLTYVDSSNSTSP